MILYALTFVGPRGRCWNTILKGEVFNTSLKAQQMLMYQKSMFDRYYCTKTFFAQNQNQKCLLVTCQNVNHSPGPWAGRLVPSSHQRSELSNTILGTFSRGDKRVWKCIPIRALEHPMPHTKFQGHRPFGSREEDFLRFLPYMGMVAILVMIWTIWINFRSPIPRRLQMKFGFNRPSGFREEDVWKCRQHTHIYTDDRGLHIL